MTSWYSLYSWSSISVSYRSRSSALTPLRLRPRPRSEECRPAEGPHAQNGPSDHGSSPYGAKDAAVRRVGPVVAHHPQPALGHGDRPEVRRRGSWGQVRLHAVADGQLRDHRARRDVEGLGDEGLDQEGDEDGQADEERDLLGQLAPRRRLFFHGERR